LDKDPFSGSMFIFRNKRRTTLKILVYDGQGFWLYVKRLSSGRFNWWPQNEKNPSINLTPAQLHLLIWNGNLPDARTPLTSPPWKNITPAAQPAKKNSVSCAY
jgi:transposase